MKRREFSPPLAGAGAGPPRWSAGRAGAGQPGRGQATTCARHSRVPVAAPAGKIEVIEFFWYGCPHCNAFEPRSTPGRRSCRPTWSSAACRWRSATTVVPTSASSTRWRRWASSTRCTARCSTPSTSTTSALDKRSRDRGLHGQATAWTRPSSWSSTTLLGADQGAPGARSCRRPTRSTACRRMGIAGPLLHLGTLAGTIERALAGDRLPGRRSAQGELSRHRRRSAARPARGRQRGIRAACASGGRCLRLEWTARFVPPCDHPACLPPSPPVAALRRWPLALCAGGAGARPKRPTATSRMNVEADSRGYDDLKQISSSPATWSSPRAP